MKRPHPGIVLGALLLPLVACAAHGTDVASSGGRLVVVAAENTWGSIASQLGGSDVDVTSIVSDPNADPHEYESSPADARLMASARYVIVNGAGYDSWADQLLAAQPESGRKVLDVADLVGKKAGDNPHFWYDPAYVYQVIARITADLTDLQPGDAAYFASRSAAFEQLLAPYKERLAYIQQHFAGTPVAATESIFQYLATYAHLDLVTPYAFMEAVAEGNDPPASTLVTFTSQIHGRAFRVLVFNVQTVTPLTTQLKEETAAEDIPVVGVSETIQPPIATFEEWMDGQLDSLINALNAPALGQ
ncbi:MAG TPA: zinc ABC transporter substrate-binding protein [Candidatus Dormibacteraeota bacterium]